MIPIPEFIIFDLDGTLLDNQEIVTDEYLSALHKNGLKLHKRNVITSLAGKSTFETARKLGVPEEKTNLIDKHFWEYFYEYALSNRKPLVIQGVVRLLNTLSSLNIPMGIITSNRREIAKLLLIKVKLDRYFNCIIGAEDVIEKKPSDEPVRTILRKIGMEFDPTRDNSDQIWLIGDTAADVICAQNANLRSVAIPQKHTLQEILNATPAIQVD